MSANDNIAAPRPVLKNIEAASGKDKDDENFPVGSFLIAKPLRNHVHAFYKFARNADDIADSPTLAPAEKIIRLDIMEAVLTGADKNGSPSAAALRASLGECGVTNQHARELLIAFRQDATKTRYATMGELLNYCRYSAAPVGRHVLDLHGESPESWPANDALCAALQINNHVQDCAADLRALDRCYLPQDLLATHNASVDDLARPAITPGLRAVLGELLTHTAALNSEAAKFAPQIKSRRLRVEVAVIAALAQRLTTRLQNQDPLAMRVKLSKPDLLRAALASLAFAL